MSDGRSKWLESEADEAYEERLKRIKAMSPHDILIGMEKMHDNLFRLANSDKTSLTKSGWYLLDSSLSIVKRILNE